MRRGTLLSAALCWVLFVVGVGPASADLPAHLHPDDVRVRASWAGRRGDLVRRTFFAGLWNVPDGDAEATFDIRIRNGSGSSLTNVTLTTDTGCFWRTDEMFGNWGIGVTRFGESDLLNDAGGSVFVDIPLARKDRFTLHVQEPVGWICASPSVATIVLTIDDVEYSVDARAKDVLTLTASWAGRTGDLVSPGSIRRLWNVPDGDPDATFSVDLVDLDLAARPRLTRIALTPTPDNGCFWRSDDPGGAWGVGVTRRGEDRLLNSSGTVDVRRRLHAGDELLTLHIEEPDYFSCANWSDWMIVELTVNGVFYTAYADTR